MAEPISVLVAEDNPINQKVVVKMLERLGALPSVAVNGEQAVAKFSAQSFDLVFMDVQMPIMDGLTATRAIRAAENGGRRTIIIALTANAMHGDRDRCLASGMDDYLAKPVKQADIEGMLEKWFPGRRTTVPSRSTPDVPSLPEVIDPKRIAQIREIGDDGLLKELLTLYLADLDQFQSDVTRSLGARDLQTVYECAHKLKGSSANLGIESVRSACVELEQLARAAEVDTLSLRFAELLQTLTTVRTHITTVYR